MKVYTEYFNIEDGNAFRIKTLLQFGESTDLIGSAVLINPGSAEPIRNADHDLIQAFYSKNHNMEIKDIAYKIFNTYDIRNTPIHHSRFEKNCFIERVPSVYNFLCCNRKI